MRALTVRPGQPNSITLENVNPPLLSEGAVLVRTLALGICGSDLEIIKGDYGWACALGEWDMCRNGRYAEIAGLSSGGRELAFDVGAFNRTVVLENHIVFGSVSANRRHYQTAADVLARADPDWLSRLITRRVPVERWREAFCRHGGDFKVIIDFVD
jgi:threonine dehydrogenase-like Zn-dependent dehydrogenase